MLLELAHLHWQNISLVPGTAMVHSSCAPGHRRGLSTSQDHFQQTACMWFPLFRYREDWMLQILGDTQRFWECSTHLQSQTAKRQVCLSIPGLQAMQAAICLSGPGQNKNTHDSASLGCWVALVLGKAHPKRLPTGSSAQGRTTHSLFTFGHKFSDGHKDVGQTETLLGGWRRSVHSLCNKPFSLYSLIPKWPFVASLLPASALQYEQLRGTFYFWWGLVILFHRKVSWSNKNAPFLKFQFNIEAFSKIKTFCVSMENLHVFFKPSLKVVFTWNQFWNHRDTLQQCLLSDAKALQRGARKFPLWGC